MGSPQVGSPQVGSPMQFHSGDKDRSMPFGAARPIMLCMVGDSGAGKSTLSDGCVQILGPDQVTDICLDDYHAYDRVERQQRAITALHPDCNHLDIMGQHMRLLRQGQRVFKPVYDHSDGTFARPELVTPRSIVFAHGLHGLYTSDLRRQWDVSVYLDPDPELRVAWKIKRDTTKRGYTREQVLEQLEHRRHDTEAYIVPQRELADIVISFYPPPDYEAKIREGRLDAVVVVPRDFDARFLAGQVEYFSIPFDVGFRKAKELLFESRLIDAEEARQLGIGQVGQIDPAPFARRDAGAGALVCLPERDTLPDQRFGGVGGQGEPEWCRRLHRCSVEIARRHHAGHGRQYQQQLFDGVEDRLLVLLQVTVVGQRQRLEGRQQT